MKNKLTINQLAIGNLRARKKQYLIMIIGIILAMFFSTSIVLFFASASETKTENNKRKFGCQNGIVASQTLNEDSFKQAKKDGYISEYSLIHYLGYAYPADNSKTLGASVCWMEDRAWELYNLRFLQGEYPTKQGEAAIELNELKRLGYTEPQLGDIIKVKFDVQNSDLVLEKQYKLVGILDDRKAYTEEKYYGADDQLDFSNYDTMIPAIYVAKNTPIDAGGREKIGCLYLSDHDKKFTNPDNPSETYSESTATYGYLTYLGAQDGELRVTGYIEHEIIGASLDALFDGGDYMTFVIIALVFASCVAIVNAFNTNLKERKKQIGLFRAVGTTKRQIINIFGREAFFISLIATPVSIALSYVVVKLLLGIISDEAVMSKSLNALIIAAVVDIIVVMLAALVPLVIASRTTPMQAIRNIDANRKTKTKKIKSKMQFNAPRHLANRNTKFYKGSTVTVSIMLVVTICFSCIAFSFVTYSLKNIRHAPNDYSLECYDAKQAIGVGVTNVDKQNIEGLSYVDRLYTGKATMCEIETDELNDFTTIIDYERYSDYNSGPENVEDLKAAIAAGPYDDYADEKKALGIQKEMYSARLQGYDDEIIKGIENCVVSGKIDYKALASGEEVVLIAPEKLELTAKITSHYQAIGINFDDKAGKKMQPGHELVYSAESDYKVGDTLTFYTADKTIVTLPENSVGDDMTVSVANQFYEDKYEYKLHSKNTVRVGAIIRPNSLNYYKNGVVEYSDIVLLTNIEGINKLVKGLNYSEIRFDVNVPLDEEMDKNIQSDLVQYNEKYQSWFHSSFENEQFQIKELRSLLTAVVALIIIGFVICISIINNSISAQIRENKRVIGTLRAVGADKRDLVSSYVRQMMAMFAWGTAVGYGLFIIFMIVIKIIETKMDVMSFEFIFNPWITVAMTVVSFAVCAINVWSKISKEMKNSIVENIREL